MSAYFPKPDSLGANAKVELNLSNYATKTDLKNETGIGTSYFPEKTDLANLKSDADKLDIDKSKNVPSNLSNLESKVDILDIRKLETTPVDLSKINNVVKNNVVKKDVYNPNIKNIEDKIPDITNLATKTTVISKIHEVKVQMLSITYLTGTAALTAVENKIPNVSELVKKADYNTKVSKIKRKITNHDHDKYIVTPQFNKLTT